jgi:V8-like Glu-specific endopeptidase
MPVPFFERCCRIRALALDARLGEALQALYELTQDTAPDDTARVMPSIAAHKRLERERVDGTVSADDYRTQSARLVQAVEAWLRDLERRQRGFVDLVPRTDSVQEAIYRTSHLRSVGWLRGGLKRARSVVRICTPSLMGSGFLITGGRILTNEHVLRSRAEAAEAEVDFDYEQDERGRETSGLRCRLNADSWRADPSVDCAVADLVPANSASLTTWEALPLGTSVAPRAGDQMSIIQHPEGKPKQLAVTANEVVEVEGSTIRYTTHTLPGSSGAPVFNDRWEVVALHARGGNVVRNLRGEPFYANEGILIAEVLRVLGLDAASGV